MGVGWGVCVACRELCVGAVGWCVGCVDGELMGPVYASIRDIPGGYCTMHMMCVLNACGCAIAVRLCTVLAPS